MKNIFFVSPCQYTRLGFSALTGAIEGPTIQVINVDTPEQIVSHINSDRLSTRKQYAIVVDMSSHEASVMVSALLFLWNLSVLTLEYKALQEIPCVLLGNESHLRRVKYPFVRVSPSQSIIQLKNFFLHLLMVPSRYIRRVNEPGRFNKKERCVINAVLEGENLSDIAKKMQVSYRNICYYRQRAILKIGLRNRNEIAWLMSRKLL